MADRITKVTLTASVNSYIADMQRAQTATKKTGTEAEQAAERFAKQSDAMREVGAGVAAFGAVAAVAFGLAVARFMEFDQAMSNVKAATQETSENMDLLRDAALEAGASTVFTATEAANAIEELGKAGLTTTQILEGGLSGALDLASAGQLSVAEAAGIAAIAVKQFNLEGGDVPHVADLLAAGAGKAVGSVQDLSAALGQAGLVANGAGQSIEDTTGTLAAFADAGLIGSDAGTSLKAAIIALQAPTQKSRDVMEKYNLAFYDAQGQMLGFDEIAGQLSTNLGGLTDEQRNAALATIFGNDALRVANVLYDEGADGIREYIDQTNDSGYAAKVAADRLDNLAGDVEKLGGAFDTALIKSGSSANDMLRGLTQVATALVDAVGGLPGPVLAGGLAVTGLVAAVGLLGGATLLAVPKIAQFKLALETLSLSGRSVALAVGGITGALAIAGVALAMFAAEQAAAQAKARAYADTLEDGTNKVTDATREMAKEALAAKNSFLWLEQDSAYDAAKKLGIELDLVTDAATGNATAMKELQKQLTAVDDGSLATRNSIADIRQAVEAETGALAKSVDMQEQKQEADKGTAKTSKTAAEAYGEAATKVADLNSELSELINAINEANGVGQDAVSANADYQASLAGIAAEVQRQRDEYEELNGTLDGFTLSLDESTVAGSDNASMLADVASKAQDAAKAQFDLDLQTMSAKDATDKYAGTLAAQRQAFIDSALSAGYNADEVQILADKVFALPTEKEIQILADTSQASIELERFITTASGAVITVPIRGSAEWTGPGFADGGEIPGRPSKRDNVLIHAATGEFVVNTDAAQKNLALLHHINNGGQIRGFANGGEIQPRYASDSYRSAAFSAGPTEVSLAGAELTMWVDGVPMRAVIQGQIVQASKDQTARLANGSRR